MNRFNAILLVLLGGVCTGCASLRIDVGVLNPEVVRAMAEEDKLGHLLPKIVSEPETAIVGRFGAVLNEHGQAYTRVARGYDEAAEKLPADSAEREELMAAAKLYSMPKRVRDIYSATQTSIFANTALLRDLWGKYQEASQEQRGELRRKLLWALDEREKTLDAFRAAVAADLREVENTITNDRRLGVAERLALLHGVQRETEPATAKELKQLLDTGGFEHSPYAYYVVNASDDQWAAKFNKTIARGFFGNSDIAVKALGPTNFTIKGLSFNPADVAATASKVMTQTVLLASQIAGVPVQVTGSPTPAPPALAHSSNRLATTMAINEQRAQQLQAHREALLRIGVAILREKAALSDDERREQALEAIRAVYESQATRIPITITSGG